MPNPTLGSCRDADAGGGSPERRRAYVRRRTALAVRDNRARNIVRRGPAAKSRCNPIVTAKNSGYLQRLYQAGREFCESLGSTSVGFPTQKRSERTIREMGFLMRRTIMVLAALSVTLLVASAGTAASPQSVTISVSRPSVVFGNSVTLSGKVSDHKVGEKVDVLAEPSGASSFSMLTN